MSTRDASLDVGDVSFAYRRFGKRHNPVVLEPASLAVVGATAQPPFLYELSPEEARAALDDPSFLDSIRHAIQTALATVPALAVLSASAEW